MFVLECVIYIAGTCIAICAVLMTEKEDPLNLYLRDLPQKIMNWSRDGEAS